MKLSGGFMLAKKVVGLEGKAANMDAQDLSSSASPDSLFLRK